MRLLLLSISALYVACFAANCAIAQSSQWGQAEDEIAPYHTHLDRRHGNDHVYPDRGAIVRDVPQRATGVNYAGISYRFAGGIWYQRLGPAYIVVTPPIGVMVPQLPAFATSFDSGGKTYLYANDVFYSPRPDLGGYEVVNDPEDDAPAHEPAAGEASPPPAAAEPPTAAQPPTQSPMPPEQPENAAVPPTASAGAPDSASPALAQSNPTGIAISPRNGQSADQQAIDRYACYRFAVTQTGFDPLAMNSGSSPAEVAQRDAEYSRAQAACLEGRGYAIP